MKYPIISHNDKRSTKLTLIEIEEIRFLKSNGYTSWQLSDKFHVSPNTINYWTNDKYRERVIQRSSKWRTLHDKTKKYSDYNREWIKKRIEKDWKYRMWNNFRIKRWKVRTNYKH